MLNYKENQYFYIKDEKDYIKFLAYFYGSEWKKASIKEIKEKHGFPLYFPCICFINMWTEEEPDWGDGKHYEVKIIEKTNLGRIK